MVCPMKFGYQLEQGFSSWLLFGWKACEALHPPSHLWSELPPQQLHWPLKGLPFRRFLAMPGFLPSHSWQHNISGGKHNVSPVFSSFLIAWIGFPCFRTPWKCDLCFSCSLFTCFFCCSWLLHGLVSGPSLEIVFQKAYLTA